jgi:protein gp37
MSKNTDIEWCDSTINPSMGCEGCELWTKKTRICYAGVLHETRHGTPGFAHTFENPEVFPDRMEQAAGWKDLRGTERVGRKSSPDKPWLNACPRTIFVGDMGDLFSVSIKDEYIKNVVKQAVGMPQHIWQFLTKRPTRMANLFEKDKAMLPRNIWFMTSVTDNRSLVRVEWLKKTDAYCKGLSIEPLFEDISFELEYHLPGIDWVVIGGASGVGVPRTEPEWILKIIERCKKLNIPVFVKQLGSGHFRGDPKGGNWLNWPRELRVRQMPLQKITPHADWQFHPTDFYAYKQDLFDQSSPNVLKSGTSIPNRGA